MSLPLPTPNDLGPDWKGDAIVITICAIVFLLLLFGVIPL